eukprot:42997-Rhodomonas_salina.1
MEILPDQLDEQRFSPSCSRISENSCELQFDLEMDARNGENEQPASEQAMVSSEICETETIKEAEQEPSKEKKDQRGLNHRSSP